MVGSFDVTKTWVSGEPVTPTDLNGNFTDVENVVNEVDTDNNLWDATRQLVKTGTVVGTVSGFTLSGFSVSLTDYELEVVAHIDKPDTNPNPAYFKLNLSGGNYSTQYINGSSTTLTGVRNASNLHQITVGTTDAQLSSYHSKVFLATNNTPIIMGTTLQNISSVSLLTSVAARTSVLGDNILTNISLESSDPAVAALNSGSRLTLYKIRKNLT